MQAPVTIVSWRRHARKLRQRKQERKVLCRMLRLQLAIGTDKTRRQQRVGIKGRGARLPAAFGGGQRARARVRGPHR
jgi:ABC-type thiamine transport system ATPase subunit